MYIHGKNCFDSLKINEFQINLQLILALIIPFLFNHHFLNLMIHVIVVEESINIEDIWFNIFLSDDVLQLTAIFIDH